jgi:hypothetical protein
LESCKVVGSKIMVLKTQTIDQEERLKRINRVYNSVIFRLAAEVVLLVVIIMLLDSQCWFGLFHSPDIAVLSVEGNEIPYTRLKGPGSRLETPVRKSDTLKLSVTLWLKERCYCSDSNIFVEVTNKKGEEIDSRGKLALVSRNGNEVTWEGTWNMPTIPATYQVETDFLCLRPRETFFFFTLVEIDLVE